MAVSTPLAEKQTPAQPNWAPGDTPGLAEAPTSITPGIAEIAGTAVRFTCEGPEEVTAETPRVIILPGLLSEQSHYDGMRGALAELSMLAITYDQPSGQSLPTALHPKHWDVMRLQSQVPYGVMKTVDEMELFPAKRRAGGRSPDQTKYALVGHSMGGPNATRLALEQPDYVDRLILLAGSGMRRHSIGEMLGRTGRFFTHDARRAVQSRISSDPVDFMMGSMGYAIRQGRALPRRTREIVTVAIDDNRPRLEALQTSGISVEAVAMLGDSYSTVEETQAIADLFDKLHVIEGDHLSPQEEPDRIAGLVASILQPRRANLRLVG